VRTCAAELFKVLISRDGSSRNVNVTLAVPQNEKTAGSDRLQRPNLSEMMDLLSPYPRDYVDSENIQQTFTHDMNQPLRGRLIFTPAVQEYARSFLGRARLRHMGFVPAGENPQVC